jgi:hypothetical protein
MPLLERLRGSDDEASGANDGYVYLAGLSVRGGDVVRG